MLTEQKKSKYHILIIMLACYGG